MRRDQALATLHGSSDFEAEVDAIAERRALFLDFVRKEAPRALGPLVEDEAAAPPAG